MERMTKAKKFTPITDEKTIAGDLVNGCITNTLKGRASGEIIPYYYCGISKDNKYGLGLSFHYDKNIGLNWRIHTVDSNIVDNEYLKYVEEVIEWVDYFMECDGSDWIEYYDFCEEVKEYQITKAEAKEKTNWLFSRGSIAYV